MSEESSEARRLASVQAVLLDYGGTLDGDAQHWFDHFVRLYADAEADIPYDVLKDAFYAADAALTAHPEVRHFGLDAMVRTHVDLQLAHHGLRDAALGRRLADAFVADTRTAWDRNRPMLRRLAERFRLGVVSNSYGNMPALLAEAELASFEIIVDSAVEGIAKPNPAIYRLAIERLGLPASAILHVGDSWERDVVPTRGLGMQSAWLALPAAAMPESPVGVRRITSLLELEALLS